MPRPSQALQEALPQRFPDRPACATAGSRSASAKRSRTQSIINQLFHTFNISFLNGFYTNEHYIEYGCRCLEQLTKAMIDTFFEHPAITSFGPPQARALFGEDANDVGAYNPK